MLRKVHSLSGFCLALMLVVTSATGAFLAMDAALDAATGPQSRGSDTKLAVLVERVTSQLPDVDKITRTPSGRIRVTYTEDGLPKTMWIDPETAAPLGPETPAKLTRTITNLHRSWLAGDNGRLAAGGSALGMLMLTLTGLVLLRRQLGSWQSLWRTIPGQGARRWHLELGRFALAGLLLSSVTGGYLSLTGFEVLPDGTARHERLVSGSGDPRRPPGQLAGLAALTIGELREITLPYSGDITDPITVKTQSSLRHVDAATGAILSEEPHTAAWHVYDLAYRLHTAQGMTVLALLLGLSAMAGTLLALTGLLVWVIKRRGQRAMPGSVPASHASIVLLVGSEGSTTWGFACTVHRALTTAGHAVHIAAMNDLPADMPQARRLILLTATAGAGEAPASATRFLSRLAQQMPLQAEVILLGFGDRQFAQFCGYADKVEAALRSQGARLALPTERIDRQCARAFAEWGNRLADHLQTPLTFDHRPEPARTYRFELEEREDYGMEVQAPTAIFRFRILTPYSLVPQRLGQVLGLTPQFSAGDLVGITPPGETRPRYYSIASSSRSGTLELCVRRLPGGACSGFLHRLVPGDIMTGHIRPNPAFHPDGSDRPLVLIGAGAGIAPLIGFVRQTGHLRPVHLFWGGRNPASDYLYREELEAHALEGRITSLNTVFSRIGSGGYVQDLIATESDGLRALVKSGAQILVCGGIGMADGVRRALASAIAPLGIDLAHLRRSGRLIEDVY